MTESTTPASTISSSDLDKSLSLVEIKPGIRFSEHMLKSMLPDVETALFFGATYELDHIQLSKVLQLVVNTPLADALFKGDHSTELQDYCEGVVNEWGEAEAWNPAVKSGRLTYGTTNPPKGEILPQMWEQMQIEVARSIKDVAAKLGDTVARLPGKKGEMIFKSMMQLNAKRPVIGDFKAGVRHKPTKENLVILDVSGSMTEGTVRAIINDVVALSYMANAHLAIVSNSAIHWAPGTYDADVVLAEAEFGGTQYEMLAPVLKGRDWGTVITIADYDSSYNAQQVLARDGACTIDELFDISLVNKSTHLAKCVGQFAKSVKPMLIGNSYRVLETEREWDDDFVTDYGY